MPLLETTEPLEYDRDSDTYWADFDTREETPSDVVVHAVAAVEGRDATDLEPLYTAIDPDALDRLFESLVENAYTGGARLQFSFGGHDITLSNHGVVEIDPSAESDTPTVR